MADSIPQHVWTATSDGGLDYLNQRAINYFGKTFDQIVDPGKFEGQRGGLIIPDIFKKNRCTKVLNDNTNVLGN